MVDLDLLFAYNTPKYVLIRDRWLGITDYLLKMFIGTYIVVYLIMYQCRHLPYHDVQGFGRIEILHPTLKNCSPLDPGCLSSYTKLDELPYCDEAYIDDLKKATEGKDFAVRPCRYFDNQSLMWQSNTFSTFFIPTHLTRVYEEAECDPTRENHYDCSNVYTVKKTKKYFVADVENFHLAIHHSFEVPTLSMAGLSSQYQGYFLSCDKNPDQMKKGETCERVAVPCMGAGCGDRAGSEDVSDEALEAGAKFTTLAATSHGDIISIKEFLQLTPEGAAGKNETRLLFDKPWKGGSNLRETGAAVVLNIEYNNVKPWHFMHMVPISYTYRPYFLPSTSFKQAYYIRPPDYPEKRVVEMWHGIFIEMSFTGKLSQFSIATLLTVLTTSVTLLLASKSLTTSLACYVMKYRSKFKMIIYQPTEDFSDYSELVDAQKHKKNYEYEPKSFSSEIIKDHANHPKTPIDNEKLFDILLFHDMRLNRIDGVDEMFTFAQDDPRDKDDVRYKHYRHKKDQFMEKVKSSPEEMTLLAHQP